MRKQHPHPRIHPPQLRDSCHVRLGVRPVRVHAHRRGRDARRAREQRPVVRAVAREERPGAVRRRPREHVHVPCEVPGRVDDVQAPVPEEVERVRERPERWSVCEVEEPRAVRRERCQEPERELVCLVVVARGSRWTRVRVGMGSGEEGAGAGAEEVRRVGEGGGVADVVDVCVRDARVRERGGVEPAAAQRAGRVRPLGRDEHVRARGVDLGAPPGAERVPVLVDAEVEEEGVVRVGGVAEEEAEHGEDGAFAWGGVLEDEG